MLRGLDIIEAKSKAETSIRLHLRRRHSERLDLASAAGYQRQQQFSSSSSNISRSSGRNSNTIIMSAAAGDGIDPRYMEAVRALTAEFASLRGDRSIESCDFPPEFLRCLDPIRHGMNCNIDIENEITSMSEWIALEKKLEGTGELTKPGTHAISLEHVAYIFVGSYAPWDRHNNNNPYRLNNTGNFAQFSINSMFTLMKMMLIQANFTPTIAHVILINKILWVDCVVSKGTAIWASDKHTKDEYEAMAWYQLGEVKNLIKAIADRCDNLIVIVFYGQKAKDYLLDWAIDTFTERGIYLQTRETIFEHPQNIGLRRVHPDNAIDMVDIFTNLFAVTGVVVPHLSDETLYEFLPTKSSEHEVEEIMRTQYTGSIILARQQIVTLYADRDKSPCKPRKSKMFDDNGIEIVLDESGAADIILHNIFVLLPNLSSITIIDINSTQTIAELKKEINSQSSDEWDWGKFDLVHKMGVLDDDMIIQSYNIISGGYVKIKSK